MPTITKVTKYHPVEERLKPLPLLLPAPIQDLIPCNEFVRSSYTSLEKSILTLQFSSVPQFTRQPTT